MWKDVGSLELFAGGAEVQMLRQVVLGHLGLQLEHGLLQAWGGGGAVQDAIPLQRGPGVACLQRPRQTLAAVVPVETVGRIENVIRT